MAIVSAANKIHWNYFLALERDLEVASRYVEFAEANMATYSIEFAHLLFAAASEVDVVAKLLCKQLSPESPRANIEDYRAVLAKELPELVAMQVTVPRFEQTLTPWDNWAKGKSPDWWRSYNNVKHERDARFHEATLKNAMNSMAGLLLLTLYVYRVPELSTGQPIDFRETTRYMQPQSTLMRFPENYYYDHLLV